MTHGSSGTPRPPPTPPGDPVGIIGFCMGGMYTLKASATDRFDRAAAFYGMARVPEQWRSPTQGEPLGALASPGRCPTLAIVGTADPWVPPADVDALEAAGVEVVRYEGADHGFVHDPARPAHRPADAADAWRRVTGARRRLDLSAKRPSGQAWSPNCTRGTSAARLTARSATLELLAVGDAIAAIRLLDPAEAHEAGDRLVHALARRRPWRPAPPASPAA